MPVDSPVHPAAEGATAPRPAQDADASGPVSGAEDPVPAPLDPWRVVRHDWTAPEVGALFEWSIPDLVFQAQRTHRKHFDANGVQLSTLKNIKAGGCPEDCKYCSQSARYETELGATRLTGVDEVRAAARAAKQAGADRFCMGAAWREVKDRDIPALTDLVRAVRSEGLETCMTLGMLQPAQAEALKAAGLDYYNHNLDTSERFYPEVVATRTYQDRLETLATVRAAGIKVCCGGILGLGETRADRVDLLVTLAALDPHPESVPVNQLVPVPGTPLADAEPIAPLELVRTIAVARLVLPASTIRLSAGRDALDPGFQTLCLLAGANSIFFGDALLTTGNPAAEADLAWLAALGMAPSAAQDRR